MITGVPVLAGQCIKTGLMLTWVNFDPLAGVGEFVKVAEDGDPGSLAGFAVADADNSHGTDGDKAVAVVVSGSLMFGPPRRGQLDAILATTRSCSSRQARRLRMGDAPEIGEPGWDSQWAGLVYSTLTDLPDGRVLITIRVEPMVLPGREVEYGWAPLPEGPPPEAHTSRYVIRPVSPGERPERYMTIEGREGRFVLA